MYGIGDHLVYGTSGVCLVSDVCACPFDKNDGRTFYVLKPIGGTASSLIYTPVENDRIPMRPLSTPEEAEALLKVLSEIPTLTIPQEKARREIYRNVIAAGELAAYVALIKTVRVRRAEFAGTQRRLPDFELEYESAAKRHLYTELSLVLGRPTAEIEACLS